MAAERDLDVLLSGMRPVQRNGSAVTGSSPEQAAAAELLEAERASTADRVAALTRDLDGIFAASADVATDDEHDPDGATIAFERAQVMALLDEARARLTDLDRAHVRLRDGTYGSCERCGSPIAGERLLVRPTARTCVACASPRRR